MKKLVIPAIILFTYLAPCAAQTNANSRIEAEKIAFFTKRLDLSPEEAREFWPVYNDYVSRKNKITQDRNALMRYVNQNAANLSDNELSESGDQIIAFIIEEAELSAKYHKKFKEILPPGKVISIYQTEAQFKKILLEQLRNKRSGQTPPQRRNQRFQPAKVFTFSARSVSLISI